MDFFQINALVYGLTAVAIAVVCFKLYAKAKSRFYLLLGLGFFLLSLFETIHEFITDASVLYWPISVVQPLGLLLLAVAFWRREK